MPLPGALSSGGRIMEFRQYHLYFGHFCRKKIVNKIYKNEKNKESIYFLYQNFMPCWILLSCQRAIQCFQRDCNSIIIRGGPQNWGRTVSADIFCAEITAGKSQRLKEITTAVGKSKHEF
jgi:hypothetical protein